MTSKTDLQPQKSKGTVWDTIKVVIQALLIALVIRTFFFQPFNIPSGSMIPTLLVGDYLFVNKLSYGYGKYSFNLAPSVFGIQLFKIGPMPFEGRIFAGRPQRGDVVVFKLPRDNETDYIKRVIGLPGDKIQVIDGQVHINGKPVKREPIDDYVVKTYYGGEVRVRQFRETLPEGKSHPTLDRGLTRADNTGVYEVPKDHYFMMGDNRDNSTDSRFLDDVGYVPYENLVGKAEIIFYSHDGSAHWWQFWRWPFAIRWGRLFRWIN